MLVDDTGAIVGTMAKADAHGLESPRHLAFSSYVFNRAGLFLATRRASTKLTWPGWWTNTCCGHPARDEPGEAAVQRRMAYELGMSVQLVRLVLPDFSYRATWGGASENELCPVYLALTDDEPTPNPDEVEACRWLPFEEFVSMSATLTPWVQQQLPLLAAPVARFLDEVISR